MENDDRIEILENEITTLKEGFKIDQENLNGIISGKTSENEKLKAEIASIIALKETNERLERDLKNGKMD